MRNRIIAAVVACIAAAIVVLIRLAIFSSIDHVVGQVVGHSGSDNSVTQTVSPTPIPWSPPPQDEASKQRCLAAGLTSNCRHIPGQPLPSGNAESGPPSGADLQGPGWQPTQPSPVPTEVCNDGLDCPQ